MSPYINIKPETCSSCDKPAIVVIVTKFNGFVIRACAKHLVQYAEIIKKGTESDTPSDDLTGAP